MSEILITGGRVIDPAHDFDATADVLIVDDTVARIETKPGAIQVDDHATRINAEGCLVAPGLIDVHVHLREPGRTHKETIHTGAAGAVNGGFTTICCMPNTSPALDSPRLIDFVHQRAAQTNHARVFAIAAATVGRAGAELAPIQALAAAGAVGFSDDGDVIAEAAMMERVLRTVAQTALPFMQHCQEPSLTANASINAGVTATRLGLLGWPAVAEEIIIERDISLNRDIGCRYHAQHLSSGRSAEIIRKARHAGQPVTAEVTPHHLLLTDQECDGYNTLAKMNPPLRTQHDIDQLKASIADGTITILGTDHAPHTLEEKSSDFESAPFGIVGLEAALPLYARALVADNVIEWPQLIKLMTIEPATLIGLDRLGIGSLAVDSPADVTIIDPELNWTIDVNSFKSMGRNCPFNGWSVKGRAITTIVGGQVKMNVGRS